MPNPKYCSVIKKPAAAIWTYSWDDRDDIYYLDKIDHIDNPTSLIIMPAFGFKDNGLGVENCYSINL